MHREMPSAKQLELAARFVAALYGATRGRAGRWRRIADCAERAGIKPSSVGPAVRMAVAAGFLVVHVDEPAVMLTARGLEAARQSEIEPTNVLR